MALRNLVEGDCGGPSPLIRLTSHMLQDRGLQEEGLYDFYGNTDPFQSGDDSDQLVKQFLEETSGQPQTFKMESLLQEMREMDQGDYCPVPVMAPGVAQELANQQDTVWAKQYLESGRHFDEKRTKDIWNSSAAFSNVSVTEISSPGETHELGLGTKWAEEYLENNTSDETDLNKLSEQFIEADPNFAYSKFMKFMRQEGSLPMEMMAQEATKVGASSSIKSSKWSDEFLTKKEGEEEEVKQDKETAKSEAIKEGDSTTLNELELETEAAGTWVDEFLKKDSSNNTEEENLETSIWTRYQKEWSKALESESSHPWTSEYETFYDPFKEYKFHEENPMKDMPNALEEGKKRVRMGDLPGAVLCFEAAVKQDEGNGDAWFMLGKTQAENEQDPLAISALKRCLELDPGNAQALMALAVSYTNESFMSQACSMLKQWLLANHHYKHLVPSKVEKTEPLTSGLKPPTLRFDEIHEQVKDLFIQAARLQPSDTIDPDVQCGLGVLFNLSCEYNKAVDCFRAALQARQDDPMLWNRLGATLANGQRSEEAVDAYYQALKLSPGFIRARYNLGISCINLNAYKEAGEHLLTALNQQAAGKGLNGETMPPTAMSNTIWSTLRLVVSLMHKYNLNKAIDNRDLATLNKEFDME